MAQSVQRYCSAAVHHVQAIHRMCIGSSSLHQCWPTTAPESKQRSSLLPQLPLTLCKELCLLCVTLSQMLPHHPTPQSAQRLPGSMIRRLVINCSDTRAAHAAKVRALVTKQLQKCIHHISDACRLPMHTKQPAATCGKASLQALFRYAASVTSSHAPNITEMPLSHMLRVVAALHGPPGEL